MVACNVTSLTLDLQDMDLADGAGRLGDKVERSVKPSFSIHILTVFALHYNMDATNVVSRHFFA